jgi:exodeoxyribonuclease V alpha subunit
VASYRLWRAERSIADQLTAMLEYGTTRLAELNATPSAVGDAPELNTDGLAADQIEALRKMQGARVFVLTGAPGTGKTYLVKRILASLGSARVALAAPTGKASMRMMEQTGQSASTIHRLLEPTPSNGRYYFARNADNPLEVDVVVLDECSMIDVTLMASFLDALPLSARLILIGDTNQLPPVGAGNVLRDIISSGVVETAELTAIKRQDAGLIIRNCHAIRDGHDITYENDPDDDFLWQDEQDEMTIANAVIDMVARRFPARGFSPTRDVQVITPKREKGELSCKALNKRLQAALNPNIPAENSRFAPGDKVIQLKNDNGLGIYNGDIGRLDAIDTGARTYTVTFENPERQVVIKWPADIDLAYAITCHKFQGSEAPAVVIPIHRSQGPRILQRSWLYTAISRARKLCVGVGQFNETPKIIRRQAQVRRYTQLEQFLREGVRS